MADDRIDGEVKVREAGAAVPDFGEAGGQGDGVMKKGINRCGA